MSLLVIWSRNRNYMLMLSKHLIDKKNTFKHVLPNACAILKSNDFKNAIFKNAIFKIALIKIVLPNRPLKVWEDIVNLEIV
jgi:hypothetical protein